MDDLAPPSRMVSQFGTPRPASGFTSMKATPTKGIFTRTSAFNDFRPYLSKREKSEKVDFNDVEEGLRKKLIGWDQIEFRREVFDKLVSQYPKY